MATETDCGDKGEQLRLSLLIRYFNKVPLPAMQLVPTTSMPVSHGPGAKFLTRAQMNLHYVQCHLDNQGASTLIVDLVIKSNHNTKIFAEVIGKIRINYFSSKNHRKIFGVKIQIDPDFFFRQIELIFGGNIQIQEFFFRNLNFRAIFFS